MMTKIPIQSFLLVFFLKAAHTEDETSLRGHWSEWGDFSACSVTCGSGTYRRSRHWQPSPNEPASLVNFTSTQELPCSFQDHMLCPVEGRWSYWSGWSACTRACGGGTMKRTRTCTSPRPAYGGKACEGESWEGEECNKRPCPPLPAHFNMSACTNQDFVCRSTKMCVKFEYYCDDIVHCHDGSDEDGCYDNNVNSVRYRFSKGAGERLYFTGSLLAFSVFSRILQMLP